jgi:ribonuclease HI
MTGFYAVAVGSKPGVYMNWNDCKEHIENYPNAVFKKFEKIEDATEFIDDYKNNLYVYTDGSCINNGKTSARAGIGIYFGKDSPLNVSRELDNSKATLTNNIAELVAVIEAITIIKANPVPNKIIVTDSEYIIKCATSYGKKLSANNWKTSTNKKPPNVELVKMLFDLTNEFNIKYKHIMAHTGNKDKHSIGNYFADLLANKAINLNGNPNGNPNSDSNNHKRVYLNVPYSEKDKAKAKGAKWDAEKKKWYIFENSQFKEELFKKYN